MNNNRTEDQSKKIKIILVPYLKIYDDDIIAYKFIYTLSL